MLLALVGPVIFAVSRTVADPDLWGHVRFGRAMLARRSLLRDEPYSYLSDAWINHEWLSEVVFALIFDAFGPAGLVALKVAVVLVLLGGVFRFLQARGTSLAGAALAALATAVLLAVGLSVRPHLFTYLALFLLLLVVEALERGRTRWLVAVPFLFAAWTNLHGGVLAGLGVLLLWGGWHAGRAIAGAAVGGIDPGGESRRRAYHGAVALAAACGATLLNPYGARLPLFLLRTATVPRPEITEWGPIAPTEPEGIAYLVVLACCGWILASVRNRPPPAAGGSPPPALLFVLGVVAVLPLAAVRHLPLFGIAAAVIAGPHVDRILPTAWRTASLSRSGRAGGALAKAGAASLLFAALAAPGFPCIAAGPPRGDPYPAVAVARLDAAGVEGNLAVFFEWGEYAIWHLGPGIQVGMDGRRETVYPDSVYADYLRFQYGTGRWEAFLADHPTDLVLVPGGSPPDNLLRLDGDWEPVHRDPVAALYARAGSPLSERIREAEPRERPADGAGLCFPRASRGRAS